MSLVTLLRSNYHLNRLCKFFKPSVQFTSIDLHLYYYFIFTCCLGEYEGCLLMQQVYKPCQLVWMLLQSNSISFPVLEQQVMLGNNKAAETKVQPLWWLMREKANTDHKLLYTSDSSLWLAWLSWLCQTPDCVRVSHFFLCYFN